MGHSRRPRDPGRSALNSMNRNLPLLLLAVASVSHACYRESSRHNDRPGTIRLRLEYHSPDGLERHARVHTSERATTTTKVVPVQHSCTTARHLGVWRPALLVDPALGLAARRHRYEGEALTIRHRSFSV